MGDKCQLARMGNAAHLSGLPTGAMTAPGRGRLSDGLTPGEKMKRCFAFSAIAVRNIFIKNKPTLL
jgi:hypothetical protein